MNRLAVSTLSNQSLVAALLCHTYTADADRALFVRLFADQVAGNGNYVAYVTIQRLGAGSAYRVVPITTAAVASGVTAACLTTIVVPVKNTDVVSVYLTGLAGDTTTPDIITEIWEDDSLLPVTAGNKLAVSAGGLADSSLAAILGTALTETVGGYLAAALKKFLDVATPVFTAASKDQTGDAYGRLTGTVEPLVAAQAIRDALKLAPSVGAAADGSIDDQLADIEAQTDDIGAAGAGLTAIPWNADWDAEVESEVDDALGSGTGAALTAIPWNASWDAEVQEECADAITAASLPTAAGVWQAITAAAANLIADHVLRRTTANVEASANGDAVSGRSLYGAVARLVHKNTVTAGVLTTTKSDDTTALTTAALTSDANASPITGVDPAA